MTKDKLVLWFIKNYPEHYKAMLNCNHYIDPETPNPYHGEGSVWTHTMMVMTNIALYCNLEYRNLPEYKTILLATGLLHDLGKPSTRDVKPATETKPIRASFEGHEGVSTFLALEVLEKLEKDFPTIYTREITNKILTLISTHGLALDSTPSVINILRALFRRADKSGSIRESTDITSQYSKRKYLEHDQDPDKEVILLVGLPNAGKSTLTKKYPDYYIISRDSSLMKFYEEHTSKPFTYGQAYEATINEPLKAQFDKYWEKELKEAKKHDKILVDMTLLSLSSRRRMLTHFPLHTRKVFVLLPNLNVINGREIERAKTGKVILQYVYENMMKSFVIPVKEEGFKEIKIIRN